MVRFFVVFVLFFAACGGDSESGNEAQTPEQLAREHCPEEFRESCARSVVEFSKGQRRAALCVGDGRWHMATPEGNVGDPCSGGGTIKVIVGGS
jgi:hypothetical protein